MIWFRASPVSRWGHVTSVHFTIIESPCCEILPGDLAKFSGRRMKNASQAEIVPPEIGDGYNSITLTDSLWDWSLSILDCVYPLDFLR